MKSKLTSDRFGNLVSTSVGTHYGVVYLGGTVNTPEQRAEVERIASRVSGVRRVVNDIAVVPRDSREARAAGGSASAAGPASTSATVPTR